MFTGKKALLLDRNSTFMFGEDRFGDSEDFSVHYFKIGGTLPKYEINQIVRAVYQYLDARYPDEYYRHSFPSLERAIRAVVGEVMDIDEIEKIIETFAFQGMTLPTNNAFNTDSQVALRAAFARGLTRTLGRDDIGSDNRA